MNALFSPQKGRGLLSQSSVASEFPERSPNKVAVGMDFPLLVFIFDPRNPFYPLPLDRELESNIWIGTLCIERLRILVVHPIQHLIRTPLDLLPANVPPLF